VLWCLFRGELSLLLIHGAFAAVLFVILALMYHFGTMGGGDLKLLTVAFLWLGFEHAFLFCILLCLASLVYVVVAKFGWVPSRKIGGRTSVPFGPSISVAWITTMLLGQIPRLLA
jgi:Flp pilus assembly protein protease CpaA